MPVATPPVTELNGPPLSSVSGVGALTLGGFLEQVCGRHGGLEALVFDDPLREGSTVRWSYEELRAQARAVARSLLASGAGKGTRVGILMGNRPEAVAALFGVALSGGVAVLLSTFATRSELAHLLRHSDCALLLTQTELGARRFVDDVRQLSPDIVLATPARDAGYPYLRRVVAVGHPSWHEFLTEGEQVPESLVEQAAGEVAPSDLGLVLYSSGTTERPKGILHNHQAPALQFWLQSKIFGRDEQTRMWAALPVFWTAGLNTAMGATLAAGGCWVMQELFEPGAALALMSRERVTEPYTLPHQAKALEEHPDWPGTDLSTMRQVYGKSVFPRHATVQGDPAWTMPVGYGMSETCAFFAAHPSDTPRDLLKESIGRLLPGNVLRVVDADSGRLLGPLETGELAVRGPTLMEHYVKRSRDECFDADGFFHTGDAGFFDEQGYVHWVGRRTEMIKTGGANVAPAEIEVALRACAPIKLARVVGVPDPRLGELVVLCAVLKEDAEASAEEVQDFLRQRLASYKVPKRVLFFQPAEMPMTSSGTKVRDAALLELVRARL